MLYELKIIPSFGLESGSICHINFVNFFQIDISLSLLKKDIGLFFDSTNVTMIWKIC